MFFSKKRKLRKATPEDDERLRKAMEENQVGFKDGCAMTIAAFLVIVLPCLLILVGICFLAMFLLGIL